MSELRKVVKEVCEECTNYDEAVVVVYKRIRNNSDMVHEVVISGLRNMVREYHHDARRVLKGKRPAKECKRGKRGMDSVAKLAEKAIQKTTFLTMVIHGKIFGDMIGKEVRAMAVHAQLERKGCQVNEKYFFMVADRVPDRKKVKSCLNDKQLEKIAEKTGFRKSA